MSDEKILSRIEKLLRLAAPSSNSTEHERASAALEAAKLISEHGLGIGVRVEDEKPKSKRATKGVWALLVALQHCSCSHCWKVISPGDHVWLRVVERNGGNHVEYRHNYAPCDAL